MLELWSGKEILRVRFEALKLLGPQQLTVVVANVLLLLALGKFVISKAGTRRVGRNGLIKRQF